MFMHGSWGGGHVLWMLFMAVLLVVPFWRITERAGHPGWLSLMVLVPLVNLGYLYFLAFVEWPSQSRGNDQPTRP